MNNDMLQTLRVISKKNILIGVVVTILITIFLGVNSALPFVIGNIIATLNFVINGTVISFVLSKNKYAFLIGLSFLIRITIVALFVIIFKNNILHLILYLIALITHQISIILYKPVLT